MSEGRGVPSLLIDPELVIPDEHYETDPDFWCRMCLLPEYRDCAVFGPYTRVEFDLFIERRLDDIYQQLSGYLSEPDVYSLYDSISRLSTGDEKQIDGQIELDAEVYCPRYGAMENRLVLQCDLNEGISSWVLSDELAWNYAEMQRSAALCSVWLVDVKKGPVEYYRKLLRDNPSYSAIERYASLAFPGLRFCDETWTTTRKLVGDERENVRILVDQLSVVNDSALTIWGKHDENRTRIMQMSSLGVDCSPENGETDSNSERVRERKYRLDGESLVMSWHLKLFKSHNRCYFYVDVPNHRVVIGGMTEHYKTR